MHFVQELFLNFATGNYERFPSVLGQLGIVYRETNPMSPALLP